jgi:GTP-binding protein Era
MSSGASTRCGFVAVLGAPNSGKSTLVNKAVGQKVSIVTQKVQTTRMAVRGIAMRGDAQLVFVDTPGIFAPKRRLDRAMVKAAWGGAADADVVLLTVDSEELAANRHGLAGKDTDRIIEGLTGTGRRCVLVLNKIDAVKRDALLPLVESLNAAGIFDRVFMISALKGDGVEDLMTYCVSHIPEGPWLYPSDQAADIPSRLLASEVTREKLYLRLHDELPYSSMVITESWKEQKDGSVRIDQTIFVERDGQKGIVVGKGGKTIKAIGEAARHELEEMFGRRVHLFLHTKVASGWGDARANYQEWGLEFPTDQ